MEKKEIGIRKAEEYVRLALAELGFDCTSEGMRRTPKRIVQTWQRMTVGYKQKVDLGRTYTEKSDMCIAKAIPFVSICEHHLQVFSGTVDIAYIPDTKHHVTGLSKLDQLVNKYAKRFQIQERMTSQIADELMDVLEPQGVLVVSRAVHTCKMCEGYNGGEYVISAVRGLFLYHAEPRMEALRLLNVSSSN